MGSIPKKVSDRFVGELGRFQKILQSAKDRDVNESDTVVIVTDILASLFGFDKYTEITSEFAIRCTFCDLAVKVNGAVKYLIEVKAIGLGLKENHLRQAIDYGANHGVEWVILTNGITWTIHHILFERPIGHQLVCEINLLDLNARRKEDQERLFLLSKEGISRAAIEEFHQHKQIVNRFTLGALMLSQPVLDVLRREMRRLMPEAKVEPDEIETILRSEVLKREVIDGESAAQAKLTIKRAAGRALRKTQEPTRRATQDQCTDSFVLPGPEQTLDQGETVTS